MNINKIAISIVSHNNFEEVFKLVDVVSRTCREFDYQIIVRSNIAEESSLILPDSVIHLTNLTRLGFGENHNLNFQYCWGVDYFIVLNPDLIIPDEFNFDSFIRRQLESNIDILSPALYDNFLFHKENNLRSFLSVFFPALIFKHENLNINGRIPDSCWLSGAFLSFKSSAFFSLNGFNTNYYLYCEDVDLCLRSHILNLTMLIDKSFKVIHSGRRMSKRSLRHFIMHISSLFILHFNANFQKKIFYSILQRVFNANF